MRNIIKKIMGWIKVGWTVISKCYLSFDEHSHKEVLDFIKSKGSFFYNLDGSEEGEIYFEISGNKGVDYSELEELKNYCMMKNISIEINCNEYSESDGGFYYNSEETI